MWAPELHGHPPFGPPVRDSGTRMHRDSLIHPANLRLMSTAEARSAFLAEASRTLAASLDYETTLATVAALALPYLGGWCIVDLVEPDGSYRRLAVVHPDSDKQAFASRLKQGWPPGHEDPIGIAAALRFGEPKLVPHIPDEMLASVAQDAEHLETLRQLGIGSLLVVPLNARGRVLGSITFISSSEGDPYTDDDLTLADDLASRAALAIDNARLYAEAEAARAEAEAANLAKSQFLATTSHEIRTPINAIIGFTDLLAMGIYGPVPGAQMRQLERIQGSAQHLLGLVNEVLDLARVEAGAMTVRRERGVFCEAVEEASDVAGLESAAADVSLVNRCVRDEHAAYLGDTDRVRQVLVNLLSNACKFTRSSGRITITCGTATTCDAEARLSGSGPWACLAIEDTGIGTVRSVLGSGARFTLWLPAAEAEASAGAEKVSDLQGLGELARQLLDGRDAILDSYVERISTDPEMPDGISRMMFQDHAVNFVSGIAQHLASLAESGETAHAMAKDTGTLQRKVAEVHGAQRHRLHWSEAALRRDWAILREETERQAWESFVAGDDKARAMMIIQHHFTDGERHSVRAWHRAAAQEPTA
jgi:signal transduction histidine kinase